jgi:hypothetical protein
MHTCKVVAAYVQILVKDFATKTRPPCKLVALRLINRQLISKKIFPVEILPDVGTAAEKLETSRELAILVRVGFDEGQDGFLHSKICNGIKLLPFGLTRHIRETDRIVGTTKGAEVKRNHIDIGAAEPKSCIPVELHHPFLLDGSKCIQQEPNAGEVDVNKLSLSLDVNYDDKGRKQWRTIRIVGIVVPCQCRKKIIFLHHSMSSPSDSGISSTWRTCLVKWSLAVLSAAE